MLGATTVATRRTYCKAKKARAVVADYLSRVNNLVEDQAEQYVWLDHHILCSIHLCNHLHVSHASTHKRFSIQQRSVTHRCMVHETKYPPANMCAAMQHETSQKVHTGAELTRMDPVCM